MNKKIVKSTILVVAAALLLLASTFAWFKIDDGTATVNTISAEVRGTLNVDYEEFNGTTWVDINQSGNSAVLIPGREYQYRAIITAGEKDVYGYAVSLDGIEITNGAGGEDYDIREYTFIKAFALEGDRTDPPEDMEDYDHASFIGKGVNSVDIINVGYFAESDKNTTTTESASETTDENNTSDDPTQESSTEESTTQETTTEETETEESTTQPKAPSVVIKAGESVTVYYTVSLQGQDIPEHNKISNATINIKKVSIIYNDSYVGKSTDE